MLNIGLRAGLMGVTIATSACSVAGTWKRVPVASTDLEFPIDSVTFDRDHNFTASATSGAENRTFTGRYDQAGRRLTLYRAGQNEPFLRGARQSAQALDLRQEREGQSRRADFYRVEE